MILLMLIDKVLILLVAFGTKLLFYGLLHQLLEFLLFTQIIIIWESLLFEFLLLFLLLNFWVVGTLIDMIIH